MEGSEVSPGMGPSSELKQMLWSLISAFIPECVKASSWKCQGGQWKGGLSPSGPVLTLAGPGEEGDQPPGGERAEGAEQEDPGGQSTGAAEGGVLLTCPHGIRSFPS